MASRGESVEAILIRLDELKKTAQAYFMVDDLTNLQRGGELSSAQALIGSLLHVKPLLHFENKVIVPFEKVRTRKKAMKQIAALLGEVASNGESYRAVIIHADREEEAKEWREELTALYPNVNFSIGYFGAVIGTHLGEGAMGMGWMKK
jgi:DegV family protein with EDD domain